MLKLYLKKLLCHLNLLPKKLTILFVVMMLAVSLYLHFGFIIFEIFLSYNSLIFIFILFTLFLFKIYDKSITYLLRFSNKKSHKISKSPINISVIIIMMFSFIILLSIAFFKFSFLTKITLFESLELTTFIKNTKFSNDYGYDFKINWLKFRASKVKNLENVSIVVDSFSNIERSLNLMLKRAYSFERELYTKWINSYDSFKVELPETILNSTVSYFKSLDFFKSIYMLLIHYMPESFINSWVNIARIWFGIGYSYMIIPTINNFSMVFNISHTFLIDILNEGLWLKSVTLLFLKNFLFFDGISFWFIFLVNLVKLVFSLKGSKKERKKYNILHKEFTIYNSFLNLVLILTAICFLVKNIFIFFIAFESILLPLFAYVIISGTRSNKISAVKFLVIYTVIGSIFLWFGIIYMLDFLGTGNYDYIQWALLYFANFSSRKLMFLCFFAGFAIKLPLVPLHHWLTVAHVEAPTDGSIVLAALLLKVGTYGLYRFVYNFFPIESYFYSTEIISLALFGFTYATAIAIRQADIKRYIAYTSIAHMNFSIIGLFSCTNMGILAYVHTSISHGVIATAMFYLVGHIYDAETFKDSTRINGLGNYLPKFSKYFFIFSLANMGLPFFSGFVGEVFIITALSEISEIAAIFIFLGFIFSCIYNLNQLRLLFCTKISPNMVEGAKDLDATSITILNILLFWVIVLGIFPDILLLNV